MSNKNNKYGVGIFEFLTITFIVLKLTGTIHWTWLQVLSPAIIAFSAGVAEGVIEVIQDWNNKKRKND